MSDKFLSHPWVGFAKEKRIAGVAELVDAPDLGSGAFGVGVRVPSPAPYNILIPFISLD